MSVADKEVAAPLMSVAAPLWFWKFWKKNSRFWEFFSEILNFLKILKIMSYNFQRRKHILTLGGVYETKMSISSAHPTWPHCVNQFSAFLWEKDTHGWICLHNQQLWWLWQILSMGKRGQKNAEGAVIKLFSSNFKVLYHLPAFALLSPQVFHKFFKAS